MLKKLCEIENEIIIIYAESISKPMMEPNDDCLNIIYTLILHSSNNFIQNTFLIYLVWFYLRCLKLYSKIIVYLCKTFTSWSVLHNIIFNFY